MFDGRLFWVYVFSFGLTVCLGVLMFSIGMVWIGFLCWLDCDSFWVSVCLFVGVLLNLWISVCLLHIIAFALLWVVALLV